MSQPTPIPVRASGRIPGGLHANTPAEATLRLDDPRCDEFWVEVFISREQLTRLLQQMDSLSDQEAISLTAQPRKRHDRTQAEDVLPQLYSY